jgi:hypothetical protein
MDAGLSPECGSPDRSPLGPQASGRRAGGIAVRPPPAARRPLAGRVWLLLVWLLAGPVRAEQPLLAPNGLHGGRYVGLADPPSESLHLAGSLGYGFTESVLGDADSHHRLAGELYAAWLGWPALQVSLGSELRYDGHETRSAGSDAGFLIATRLTARHAFRVHPRVALAAQESLLFPGAASAKDGFIATTTELSALGSYALSRDARLGLMFGYRVDRTEHAVPEWRALSPSDRLAAALSSHDAFLLGAIGSFALWSLNAAVELAWDVPAAGDLPAINSPMRLRTVLQKQLWPRCVPAVELGFDASARPGFEGLVRIEPRFWARLGVSVLLDAATPQRQSPAPRALPAKPAHKLVVSVLDERGWPLAGARVALSEPAQAELCDAFGRAALELPSGGSELTVEAEGYQPVRQNILPGASGVHSVKLAPRLPAGEIKGAVRNLAGEPLRARIEVLPLGLVAFSDAQGRFLIEVAPGDYTLRIGAEGYEDQERTAQVELRGVTILVVDLRKAAP